MTYRQALAALEARQETRIELGLGRVRALLARLGDPQAKLRCFHVAGTNGKGSTCAILDSSLRAAGYKTGFYSSPHLQDVRERIQVSGRPISKKDFAKHLSAALAAETKSVSLTYFELLTVVAFLFFAEKNVDVAVLETGLGGRLDATNVVDKPLASIITSIDFDHMNFLGDTLPKIAAEKAGIAKRGVPLLCPKLAPAALRAVRAGARRAGAKLSVVEQAWPSMAVDWQRGRQTLGDPALGPVELSLLGERQGLNAALARVALDAAAPQVAVPPSAWKRGLSRVRWPGRFEVRRLRAKTAILDGAHNAEAMENLARTWSASPWAGRRARWIIGLLRDKDAAGLLRPLAAYLNAGKGAEVVAVRPPSPRALDAAELARLLRRQAPRARVTVESDAETALRRWRRQPSAPRAAVVCGSFYLVAGAAKALKGAGHA